MTSCTFSCAACGHAERGTWFYRDEDRHKNLVACSACGAEWSPNIGGILRTPAFPFTSKHITGTGEEITVESYRHLQQVEKRYGVAIMNNSEESHTGTLPRFRPGGRDADD